MEVLAVQQEDHTELRFHVFERGSGGWRLWCLPQDGQVLTWSSATGLGDGKAAPVAATMLPTFLLRQAASAQLWVCRLGPGPALRWSLPARVRDRLQVTERTLPRVSFALGVAGAGRVIWLNRPAEASIELEFRRPLEVLVDAVDDLREPERMNKTLRKTLLQYREFLRWAVASREAGGELSRALVQLTDRAGQQFAVELSEDGRVRFPTLLGRGAAPSLAGPHQPIEPCPVGGVRRRATPARVGEPDCFWLSTGLDQALTLD